MDLPFGEAISCPRKYSDGANAKRCRVCDITLYIYFATEYRMWNCIKAPALKKLRPLELYTEHFLEHCTCQTRLFSFVSPVEWLILSCWHVDRKI